MKKLNRYIILVVGALLTVYSCKKATEEVSDLDKLRNNTNQKSYPVTKMDSTQVIQFITKQKVQELLDLSTLYSSGKDTEIDSIIYAQMNGYFLNPDSLKLKPILRKVDSLKAKSAKVGNLVVSKEIVGKDTLDYATFDVEFFDKSKKSLGSFTKTAQYYLKPSPIKFKKEFKFYFKKFDAPFPKDSASVGVKR